jgi:2-keto-4-pentenoate hydratase/2-oxohepta-3-ene-1,7-dioic acid hydratase in catechol pathway
MRIARYETDGAEHYGLLEGDILRRVSGDLFGALTPTGHTDQLAEVKLLAPIKNPRVFAVGMNYVGHIKEAGAATPEIPVLFMMPTTAVIGAGEPIVLPREAQIVEHECELTIVIGRMGRRIAQEDALDHVLGYTCSNDVSERVIQRKETPNGCLLIGKAFDTFCPMGPVIATGLDPGNLSIQTRVNGEIRQDGHTSDLLFSVPYLVSYISQAISLLPGDVILTGTPSGVGLLKPGDQVEIIIQGIGTLSNPVTAET